MKRNQVVLLLAFLVFIDIFTLSSLRAQDMNKEVFANRRLKIMDEMKNGIAIMRNDSRSSDFFYLTGFEEPDAFFLLIPKADKKFIMFVKARNPLID